MTTWKEWVRVSAPKMLAAADVERESTLDNLVDNVTAQWLGYRRLSELGKGGQQE